jgi:hypothetical protein
MILSFFFSFCLYVIGVSITLTSLPSSRYPVAMEQVHTLIPNRLQKLRMHFGYSLKEVAFIIGIRNPYDISQWEQGITLPNATNMLKLSALYRTSCNELYYDLLNRFKQEITMKEHRLFEQL